MPLWKKQKEKVSITVPDVIKISLRNNAPNVIVKGPGLIPLFKEICQEMHPIWIL